MTKSVCFVEQGRLSFEGRCLCASCTGLCTGLCTAFCSGGGAAGDFGWWESVLLLREDNVNS